MDTISDIAKRIKTLRKRLGYSYSDMAKLTGLAKSTIQRYETGFTEKIPLSKLNILAQALNTTPMYIMGWDEEEPHDCPEPTLPANILPMPDTRKIPLLGTIACGDPILAEQNIEDYVDIPEHINADFALRCQGDSMINARIFDGDIVYIREQPTVESGEIAAVMVDDDTATLKRVEFFEDHIILAPENPHHRPQTFWEDAMDRIRILGKAVAFTSKVR